MRRLTKAPQPQVLADNAEAWTRQLLLKRGGDEGIPEAAETRYRHPDIKAAAIIEAHHKCIYCESKLTHTQPGDIEHIRPKSVKPDLAFKWENLGLACRNCNQAKGTYDDPRLPLVNPFVEDPNNFLRALGPFIEGTDAGHRGKTTERRCRLNRSELMQRRSERITSLKRLIDFWRTETDPSIRREWAQELVQAAGDSEEYTMVVRAYLRQWGLSVPDCAA